MAQVTDLAVRNAAPRPEGEYILWFDDGLGLRVQPSGHRSFVYWYRVGKGKRRLTLGPYPRMTVKDAIAAHKTARAATGNGGDPAAEKQHAKTEAAAAERAAEREAARGKTFREVFDHWVRIDLKPTIDAEGNRTGRKDGGDTIRRQFELRVFDKLGQTPIREVGKADLLEILDGAKDEGKQRTAGLLFSNLRQMLDFAVDRDYIERNPLATIKRHKIAGKTKPRTRVLADWEVTRFLRRLPVVGLHAVTQLALRFVLCTGQRPGEVAGMPKAELSKDGAMWTIPADRYKTGEKQQVPLSAYAQGILAEAAKYNQGSAFVFGSPQNKPATLGADAVDRPFDRHSLSRAILRKLGTAKPSGEEPEAGEFGLAHFTPHDLRRTLRTGLAALGVTEPIAEKVIGHKLEGMMAVYNQHDYLDERRAALELWGAKLAELAKA